MKWSHILLKALQIYQKLYIDIWVYPADSYHARLNEREGVNQGGGYQLQSLVTFLALERFKAKFVQSGVTLITYCYKKLINLLTKLLTLYHVWLLFNILYAILNSQEELKKI